MSRLDPSPITRKGTPWTFEQMATRAKRALAIMEGRGIRVHRDSALSKALLKAGELAKVMADPKASPTARVSILIDAGYANRVAEAIIATAADDNAATRECLRRMAGSHAAGDDRAPSQGKDAMWELDLLARLRRLGVPARLGEPDIVCDFGFGDYAIACKRLHRERTLPAMVRKGSEQIRKSGMSGMVAVDMDNLLPHYATVAGASDEAVEATMSRFLEEIHLRQQRGTQKFLFEGRCDAVLACLNVQTDIESASPRFSSLSQMIVWTLNEVPIDAHRRLSRVSQAFGAIRSE